MRGMFVYLADAALFTECLTDRRFPVAMEGAYLELEKAYLNEAGEPGAPLMASVEGSIQQRPAADQPATRATVVVERFINVWPGETCERNRVDASLTNTYWRLVKLGEDDTGAAPGRREPHLLLQEKERRFRATVGCNQLIGRYDAAGSTLRFHATASTRMVCPPPLDRLEQRLITILETTATSRIDGQFLELEDEDGQPIALLQAVYLP
jgi:heat shock protein HslJ